MKLECSCCGYKTIENEWDICEVCFWENDPVQNEYSNECCGANNVSLNQAKENFLEFGACEIRFKSYVITYDEYLDLNENNFNMA